MNGAILLLLLVYVALKGARLAFSGARSNYRAEPVSFRQQLRSGEPTLLIVAVVLSIPPAVAATWYHHHKFTAELHESANCFGLISAYSSAPEIIRSNGEYTVYMSSNGYRASALDAARQLGLRSGAARQQIDTAAAAMTLERARATGLTRRDRIASTQHCLNPPPEEPNA